MTRDIRTLTIALVAGLVAQTALSDEPAAPVGEATQPMAAHQDGAQPKPAKPKSSALEEAGEPRAATSADGKARKTADRVDLDTTTVTGNRELPKVMYVVPWKKSDIGDLGGKPMNSLLDEVLAPVDRDVFRREVVYYQALKADAPPQGAGSPAPQGEK